MSDDLDRLRQSLSRIDGRGYKAYKDIQGLYRDGDATLYIDHVQGDPFAEASKIRVRVAAKRAQVPRELYENEVRRLALQDFLAREVHDAIASLPRSSSGSGKSGLIEIDAGAQEVLQRTALVVTEDWVEARIHVGLPANGRRILGRQADTLLCKHVLENISARLCWDDAKDRRGREFVECIENVEHIRGRLGALDLVAFIADGSVLPRASGVDDRPMKPENAVAFTSPDSFRVTIEIPNALADGSQSVTGMGVPKGVTLIVGGGYHGKSTLLQSIERGVYPHIPGDGREYVVTARDTVKIRAEDGRRVEKVDISPFITNLPRGRDTEAFSSEDASGSTSQAANIVEALEVGAGALLLDEDTSATNFMVRDARMQALVHKDSEPITPFVERVRELYDAFGVSSIVVMGGCGDYFEAADHVILMRDYQPSDATEGARSVAAAFPTKRKVEVGFSLRPVRARIPLAESFDPSRGRRPVKIDVRDLDRILYGRDPIDLRGVEQLVDISQTRAIGHAIHLAATRFVDGARTLRKVLECLESVFDEEGLDLLDPFYRKGRHPGNYARPRKFEIAAAINRLRTVGMNQAER